MVRLLITLAQLPARLDQGLQTKGMLVALLGSPQTMVAAVAAAREALELPEQQQPAATAAQV